MIILHLWPEMILIFLHCLSFRILYANQLTIAVIFEKSFWLYWEKLCHLSQSRDGKYRR